MATKKNAARVAVKAEPCQKQPDLQPRDALDCIALGLPLSAVQPVSTEAHQQGCRDGYNRAQLVMALESIAEQMVALNGILRLAQTCDDHTECASLVGAAQALAQGIGCIADHAAGDEVLGDVGRWHCGPHFATAGGAA